VPIPSLKTMNITALIRFRRTATHSNTMCQATDSAEIVRS
jgi:hypothetical protein